MASLIKPAGSEPPTVLVTRPLADAAPFVARLQTLGYQTLVEPMLAIVPLPDASIDLTGCQAILFTSANGVRAFASLSSERSLPVVAVGAASATEARSVGFQEVLQSGGDVVALAETVRQQFTPANGILFHAAGSRTAGDLKGALERDGFRVRRTVLYQTKEAERLSATCLAALDQGKIDAVTLFSPRTAVSFVKTLERAGRSHCARTVWAACLSPAVAQSATDTNVNISWAGTVIAAQPNTDSLLACLNTLLNGGKV